MVSLAADPHHGTSALHMMAGKLCAWSSWAILFHGACPWDPLRSSTDGRAKANPEDGSKLTVVWPATPNFGSVIWQRREASEQMENAGLPNAPLGCRPALVKHANKQEWLASDKALGPRCSLESLGAMLGCFVLRPGQAIRALQLTVRGGPNRPEGLSCRSPCRSPIVPRG